MAANMGFVSHDGGAFEVSVIRVQVCMYVLYVCMYVFVCVCVGWKGNCTDTSFLYHLLPIGAVCC